jgi:hypothetical protein
VHEVGNQTPAMAFVDEPSVNDGGPIIVRGEELDQEYGTMGCFLSTVEGNSDDEQGLEDGMHRSDAY